ncbi:MAG TPA: hypothetical protein ENI06_05310 [Spirochaetales bacterium]|nr:hypothetical protein [Spirochaetales bacterium]
MSKTVLITDIDTPLGFDLSKTFLEQGDRVVGTVAVPDKESNFKALNSSSFTLRRWQRSSSLSAKNLLLSIINDFNNLDEALLLQAPSLPAKLLHEVATAEIEHGVDLWIKGNLFLLKEILELFNRGRGGVVALINYSPHDSTGILPPLESALRGSFQALAKSLFSSYSRENLYINGFESNTAQSSDFADFIRQTLSDRGRRVSGRWFRFQAKSGLFSPFRIASFNRST